MGRGTAGTGGMCSASSAAAPHTGCSPTVSWRTSGFWVPRNALGWEQLATSQGPRPAPRVTRGLLRASRERWARPQPPTPPSPAPAPGPPPRGTPPPAPALPVRSAWHCWAVPGSLPHPGPLGGRGWIPGGDPQRTSPPHRVPGLGPCAQGERHRHPCKAAQGRRAVK